MTDKIDQGRLELQARHKECTISEKFGVELHSCKEGKYKIVFLSERKSIRVARVEDTIERAWAKAKGRAEAGLGKRARQKYEKIQDQAKFSRLVENAKEEP